MHRLNDAEKLRRWLEDYELERILTENTGEEHHGNARLDPAQTAPLAEGQIRLWPAAQADDPPLYGLLLAGDYGRWRVIPFSPLAFAATPEEWACRQTGPARVLQGWNRRELASAVAANSWLAEDAAAELLLTCRHWWTLLEAGASPAAAMIHDLGPPLRHPLDPRHDYLQREDERVTRHLGESHALRTEQPAAWAAEGGPVYGSSVWRIGDSGDRWVADADGAWVESTAGPDAWIGALLLSDAGQWEWRGEKILLPRANARAWTELRWRGEVFPLQAC